MLHIVYILAFTIVAFFTVKNLIGNLITLSTESDKLHKPASYSSQPKKSVNRLSTKTPPHPELLDKEGKIINEPLLVMRSVSVEDAREKLDALYNSSPSITSEDEEV